MTLQIHWTDRALKDVARLDRHTRERIMTAVERLAESGRGDIRRLQGTRDEIFRLRIGDWRLLFSQDLGAATLVVRRVLPRGGAYQP